MRDEIERKSYSSVENILDNVIFTRASYVYISGEFCIFIFLHFVMFEIWIYMGRSVRNNSFIHIPSESLDMDPVLYYIIYLLCMFLVPIDFDVDIRDFEV